MKALIMSLLLIGTNVQAQEPALNCDIGPANKTYGGATWYVYACGDKHSVVVVTAPGSAAMPFYFMFAFKDGKYRLVGEGTGNKAITDAVYKELSSLRESEIAALYSEASKVAKK
jgi:hypothetical protein